MKSSELLANVSRETSERLDIFAALLQKWNRTVNLVSPASLPDLRDRHFKDSAQIWDLCHPAEGHWLDIGSGGGFPGLIVAILAAGAGSALQTTLVESDHRKAAFLRTVALETGLSVDIKIARVEDLSPQSADFLSARALAPLSQLLEWTNQHRKPDGVALFPKGRTVHKEVEAAQATWKFNHVAHQSRTDPQAGILEIGALNRVRA